MSVSNQEIVESVQQMDFDRRMLIFDAFVIRVVSFWPEQIRADEFTELQQRALKVFSVSPHIF